ncbi:hypothetical protein MUO79_03060 [Candidatus Bathyarchaeota archaeon]|nr:hypothetical protein [Candidatus Bathyarchaeota archaeon]
MQKLKYKYTEKTIMEWANQYESIKTYLSRLNSRKERAALSVFDFCDWADKTPDELLMLKSSHESLEAEKLLDKFVYSKVDMPESKKWLAVNATRGFFRANYKQLQSQAGRMEYVNAKPQRLPTKQQRLALYKAAYNPRDRALVLFVCCSAIARETIASLHWSHLEEDWQSQEIPHISIPPELLKGHGKGKYRGTRQETFITPEAKQALIDYRNWFQKTFDHIWQDEHIFLSVRDNVAEPLSTNGLCNMIGRMVKRSGVKFGIHDGRRIVETALENASTPRNWIQKIKGRKVRGEDAPYSKPAIEQLRAKYREALPELELLRTEEAEMRQTDEMERLKREFKNLEARFHAFSAYTDEGIINELVEKASARLQEQARSQG